MGTDRVIALTDLIAELAHIKVDLLALFRAAGHLAQLHDAGDQRRQPVGLIHDDVHLLVPVGLVVAGDVPHRLRIALDEGQRGAQVMGDICQQVALHLGRVLDFLMEKAKISAAASGSTVLITSPASETCIRLVVTSTV